MQMAIRDFNTNLNDDQQKFKLTSFVVLPLRSCQTQHMFLDTEGLVEVHNSGCHKNADKLTRKGSAICEERKWAI